MRLSILVTTACIVIGALVGAPAELAGGPAITWSDSFADNHVVVKGGMAALPPAAKRLQDQGGIVVVGRVARTEPMFLSDMCWYRTRVTLAVHQCPVGGLVFGDTVQFLADNSVAPCRDGSGWYCLGESNARPWVIDGDCIVAALVEQEVNQEKTGYLCDVYVGFMNRCPEPGYADSLMVYGQSAFTYDGHAYVGNGDKSPAAPYRYMAIARVVVAPLSEVLAVLVQRQDEGGR
jgi:hypothetical protein